MGRLSRPSVFVFNCSLLLKVRCSLLWIFQPLKHTFFIPSLTVLTIGFLPFSNLFPIICISTVGFVVNAVKLLHILITVSFGDAGQTDFQNVYFLILAVNFALQFAFLGKSRNSFQVVTFKFPIFSWFTTSLLSEKPYQNCLIKNRTQSEKCRTLLLDRVCLPLPLIISAYAFIYR